MSFGGVASLVPVMRRESHAVAAALHPPHGPRTVVLMIDAPLTADTVASLCDRVGAALRGADVDLVTCDVRRLTAPDVYVAGRVGPAAAHRPPRRQFDQAPRRLGRSS